MKNLPISEKEKRTYELLRDFFNEDYSKCKEYKYKINAYPLMLNVFQDCDREQMVSFFEMVPIYEVSVPLEEADYILYANPFARVEDFTESVLEELELINKYRKDGSEIIVCGKASNIKDIIGDKYSNITYVPSHYAEYLGKRFELDMKEEYVIYDDRDDSLNLWPVDGCLNKCGFCRRSYMHIPFESQPLHFLKERLDWFKENHPEQMRYLRLRGENLTQYGLDIENKQILNQVIDLVDSYEEVKKYLSLSG